MPHLGASELRQIGGGKVVPDACKTVIGPGTGLGTSVLVPAAQRRQAVAGEGGHVYYAPADETDEALLRIFRRRWTRASIERFISGPGLVAIYQGLAAINNTRLGDPPDAAAIAERACVGTDPLAAATVEQFSAVWAAPAVISP